MTPPTHSPDASHALEPERADLLGALRRRGRGIRSAFSLRNGIAAFAHAGLYVGAAGLWLTMALPALPRWPILIVLLVVAFGLYFLRKTPLTEQDVVAYIDARLDAQETILSAWEAVQGESAEAFDSHTLRQALRLLQESTASTRPTLLPVVARTLPLGLATLAALWFVPVPSVVAMTGPETLRIEDASLLERIERLEELAPDEESRRLLAEARAEAAELQRALAEGVDPREALDSMDSIREQLERVERQSQSTESEALQEAVRELADEEPEMAEALAERNLEDLDREVTRAAARREEADRQRARQALERAAEAARDAGDEELAESLLRRRDLLDQREEQAALARRLAEAMPELMEGELGRQLERLSRDGDASDLDEATVDAMEEAWSRLTPEERRQLAEAMRRQQAAENRHAAEESESEGETLSADEYERMLRESLEHLEELQRGAGQGGQSGGAMPVPRPGGQGGQGGGGQGAGQGSGQGAGQGSGQGAGQGSGQGQGAGQGGGGSGAGGQGGGSGQGNAGGTTPTLEGGEGPLARVRPRVGAGTPSRSWIEWGTPGAPTDQGGGGGGIGGGSVGPSEGGGIGRSRVPADYEDHVRTYFHGERERRE